MSKQVRIVSFDPASLRNLGWCYITYDEEDTSKPLECLAGTFIAPKFEGNERYLALWPIYSMVDAFLDKFKPSVVVIEQTSAFRGSFITGQVSQCMGSILTACGKHEMKVEFVYPSSVKKRIAGHGRATKTQVRKAVQSLLKKVAGIEIKFDSEHSVDATANILNFLAERGIIEVETHE